MIVGRLHLYVNCLNYLLFCRGVHWYGSPDLPMGRLLCGIRGHVGPFARFAQGDSGAPVARLPHRKITAFSPPYSLFAPFGCFPK